MSYAAPPTKPVLQIEVRSDGGMCLDRINSERLGTYILQLEDYAEHIYNSGLKHGDLF